VRNVYGEKSNSHEIKGKKFVIQNFKTSCYRPHCTPFGPALNVILTPTNTEENCFFDIHCFLETHGNDQEHSSGG